MILYGVCNHTIPEFVEWRPRRKLHIHSPDARLRPGEMKGRTTVFSNIRDIVANLEVLNQEPVTAILFSGPLRVAALSGVYPLDMHFEHTPPHYGVRLQDTFSSKVWDSAKDRPIEVAPLDYTATIISHVESTSILTDFMTIIYTLPSATHQKPVKVVLLNWLYYGGDMKMLDFLLTRISETLTLSSRNIDKFSALFKRDIADRIKRALARIRDGEPVPDVAAQCCVSAYDIRYILSIVKDDSYSEFERICVNRIRRNTNT